MSYTMGSLIAVVIGAALDLLLGDPQTAWHPICLIGYLIAFVEKVTRKLFPKTKTGERAAGVLCAILVVTISTTIPAADPFVGSVYGKFLAGRFSGRSALLLCTGSKDLKEGEHERWTCA